MSGKVSNEALLDAGLAMLKSTGQKVERVQTGSRAMMFCLDDGKTIRARTCNDHVLVVLAESAEPGAHLNIEGTDYLLIVMPEVPRTPGAAIAYFLPTSVAVEAVRRSHAEWLASNPNTKGNNRTWNIWFDNGASKSGGFAEKWSQYRLASAKLPSASASVASISPKSLGTVIAEARQQIATAAGVPVDAVKISVALD